MSFIDRSLRVGRSGMQGLLNAIYPPTCLACDQHLEGDRGLCPSCWSDTPFIHGLACDQCGVPLPGTSDRAEICDDCRVIARPWSQGRAALVYGGKARELVLGLKHGDRTELAPHAAQWMARAGRDILTRGTLIVPVPSHWSRALSRRYDQAEMLALALASRTRLPCRADALIRTRATGTQDGKTRPERFANTEGAFRARGRMDRQRVILIDDVMTSGATFAAAAEACRVAGASEIAVLALARAVKDA